MHPADVRRSPTGPLRLFFKSDYPEYFPKPWATEFKARWFDFTSYITPIEPSLVRNRYASPAVNVATWEPQGARRRCREPDGVHLRRPSAAAGAAGDPPTSNALAMVGRSTGSSSGTTCRATIGASGTSVGRVEYRPSLIGAKHHLSGYGTADVLFDCARQVMPADRPGRMLEPNTGRCWLTSSMRMVFCPRAPSWKPRPLRRSRLTSSLTVDACTPRILRPTLAAPRTQLAGF